MTDQTVAQPPKAQPAAEPPRKSLSEIASEVFGSEYKGDVKPLQPEPKPTDTEEGEAPEEVTEGDLPEVEAPDDVAEETAPEEDTGETPIATLSELVEHLEADPEWAQTLRVPVTVDGTPTEATIGELVKNYQLAEAAEHRLEAAKTIAAKESEIWAAKQQQAEEHVRVTAELVKAAEAALERDIKAVDPRLREEDPAEWSARVQEFQGRHGFIEKMKADTLASYHATTQARAAEFQQQKQAYTEQQRQVLLDKLPEWRDPDRATTEQVRLIDYLYHEGFAHEELENLVDHRQLLMARKAMLYDESRGQVDTAKKRVAKVPKIMRSGAPKSRDQLSSEKLQALKSKMEKSGSMDDAVAYRLAKRGVSR